MVRELWRDVESYTENRATLSLKVQGKSNKEIKRVFGSLKRKADNNNWVKFVPLVRHSINISPHSTLEYQTPYRVLFGRDPLKGRDLGIPDEISQDVTTEEEYTVSLIVKIKLLILQERSLDNAT